MKFGCRLLEVLSWYLTGGLSKTTKVLSQDNCAGLETSTSWLYVLSVTARKKTFIWGALGLNQINSIYIDVDLWEVVIDIINLLRTSDLSCIKLFIWFVIHCRRRKFCPISVRPLHTPRMFSLLSFTFTPSSFYYFSTENSFKPNMRHRGIFYIINKYLHVFICRCHVTRMQGNIMT
jgi:hypothetical protein